MTPMEWAILLVAVLVVIAVVLYLADNELVLELATELID